MPSLQHPRGSNPSKHLMVPISTRNITQASQLIAHTGNASSSAPVQPKASTQREAPQVPTPNTTRPADNSNTTRNFPPRPLPEFTPLPMTYKDLLPSLIANHLAVVTPGRVLEPPFRSGMTLMQLASTMGVSRGIPSKNAWPLNTRSNILWMPDG